MADADLPEIRLSDAERDEVVSQLNLAMTEGRLDADEFSSRSRQVYAAKVPSDLEGVLEGLPVSPLPSQAPSRGTRWFFSLLGDRVQRGDIDLGDKAISISVLGDTTFDLRSTSRTATNLRIFSLLGDVTVLVRPGTQVAASIFMLLGDRQEDVGGPTNDATLNVRVYSVLGDVKIRVVDDN